MELQETIDVLELPSSALDFLNKQHDLDEMGKGLEKFKGLASRQRKALAKKHHPDVCEGDGERMKAINDAADFVTGLRIKHVRMRPVFQYWGFSTQTSTTSSSTTTSFSFNIDF